jgi:hypothetical protein|tara:strand:+ start:193 stop:468 length:276 start_codon:yes stop_codon:yes gene_type:complete
MITANQLKDFVKEAFVQITPTAAADAKAIIDTSPRAALLIGATPHATAQQSVKNLPLREIIAGVITDLDETELVEFTEALQVAIDQTEQES